MSRKKKIITPIGKDEAGKTVIGGVFKMYDTLGLPLSTLFDALQDKGLQPCWPSFYNDAIEAGWTDKTILSRLTEAITDSYGRDYCNQWAIKLEQWRDVTHK